MRPFLCNNRKQRRTMTALSVSVSAMDADVCIVSGSDANTVKILRLSAKRPLCAMQSKLPQRGLTRLPQIWKSTGRESEPLAQRMRARGAEGETTRRERGARRFLRE